jgi:DNA-binding Lrp family transcriptional regulator
MKGVYHVFVFIDTDPDADERVEERLLEFDEVVEVHYISGEYDLLAVIEINLHGKAVFTTVQEIAQQVIQKIRRIRGVRDTNSMVPFVSFTKKHIE